ncbi:hypothetical protein WN51_07116 [Melipona quadrifasciata]|uniref:Uncharacterized protein n=1 Tax=Melipona quadrifasciata TaxID=166423 RepID=A0A0M8ZRH1_9HYME|nr:hypothetical protein WN51_07116 [Melipona quadrifasciata]
MEKGAMKRRGEIQREGNERETLHSVAPSRVENAALCWGSLCIREEVPGLKEKKALVRLRWRRIRGRKGLFTRPSATKAQRDRLFLADSSRLPRRTTRRKWRCRKIPPVDESFFSDIPNFCLRLAFLAIFCFASAPL